MGYYVYQEMATLTRKEITNLAYVYGFHRDNFEGFDTDLNYFLPFLQDIDIPVIDKEYSVLKYGPGREKEFARLEDRYKHHLRYEWTNYEGNKFITRYHMEKRFGFYAETVAEIKLQAGDDFRERYENGIYFTEKEVFEKAGEYPDAEFELEAGLRTMEYINYHHVYYRKNFIERYRPNQSFLIYC